MAKVAPMARFSGFSLILLNVRASRLNSLNFSGHCFVPDRADETILHARRNHFPLWRRCPETADGYQVPNETAGTAGHGQPETSQMRTTSFILAFAFILAGPSMAGSSDQQPAGRRYLRLSWLAGSEPCVPADGRGRQLSVAELLQRSPFCKKIADKGPDMCWYASVPLQSLSFLLLSGAAQAQVQFQPPQTSFRSLFKVPDPRGEFVRLCAPHMVGRWAHPESVCGCLHDYAAATVEDADLREAPAARHQRDRGADHRDRVGAAVEAVRDRPDLHQDRQADAAVHVRAGDEQVDVGRLSSTFLSASTRRERSLQAMAGRRSA